MPLGSRCCWSHSGFRALCRCATALRTAVTRVGHARTAQSRTSGLYRCDGDALVDPGSDRSRRPPAQTTDAALSHDTARRGRRDRVLAVAAIVVETKPTNQGECFAPITKLAKTAGCERVRCATHNEAPVSACSISKWVVTVSNRRRRRAKAVRVAFRPSSSYAS